MWLDRLATQGPSSRTISPLPSPLPRRTSSAQGAAYPTYQRPGLSKKNSSTSLASTVSSTSGLASTKRVNGSGLKHSTTVSDGPDPEEVLAKIVGSRPDADGLRQEPDGEITEEDLDLEYEFGDLSLRDLAAAGEKDRNMEPSPQSIQEFESQKAKFEELHRSIMSSDEILGSVETNLTSFRNDLAVVSAHIETLQARSTALNVRLENRQAVEKRLAPVVEELSVSPVIVSKIVGDHVDEAWVKTLAEVEKRTIAFQQNAEHRRCKAAEDLNPLLQKLSMKAVERIRDFMVAQIKALRSPQINAQIIQQRNFLRFKDLYTFLHKQQPTLADEICLAYMNTMRWYYLNQFTRYQKALDKIKLHRIDKSDTLGHEDTSRKATVLSGAKGAGPPQEAFNLVRRMDILKTQNQAALSSYLAEEDHATHYIELPFRNFNLALADNAAAEYTFMCNFFIPALPMATINRHFNYIFEPTFALGQTLTKQLVGETGDTLGLLLCVRLNQHLALEMQRRRIPAVDGYINGTSMALWPRLQGLMDGHCESVRALTTALPTKAPTAAVARQASAAPHLVTQRFGQLLQGILVLGADADNDEPVVASLGRLRNEVEAFLTKYAVAIFGADKRKRERFLYNNYSLVLTIIGDVVGKLAVEHREHFEALKKAFQEAT